MIGLFSSLPPALRITLGIVLILVSTGLLFAGTIWPYGWIAGAIFLLFGGRTRSEKNGYNF